MKKTFKPQHYNSLSPYLVMDNAAQFIDFAKKVFHAQERRKFQHENGTIIHAELLIDDSILMITDSTKEYPARTAMLHLYVPDSTATYQLALQEGCQGLQAPVNHKGDPDKRGNFLDFAGNYWSVSTQMAPTP